MMEFFNSPTSEGQTRNRPDKKQEGDVAEHSPQAVTNKPKEDFISRDDNMGRSLKKSLRCRRKFDSFDYECF
jgi:hypothetical protein